jgi:hypothetical protein
MLTPNGNLVKSTNLRLMEFLLRHLSFKDRARSEETDLLRIFGSYIDSLQAENELYDMLCSKLEDDYIYNRIFRGDLEANYVEEELLKEFNSSFEDLLFLFDGIFSIFQTISDVMMAENYRPFELILKNKNEFIEFVHEKISELPHIHKSVLLSISESHRGGVILPMLLINSRITVSEYASTLVAFRLLNDRSYKKLSDTELKMIVKNQYTDISNDTYRTFEFLTYFKETLFRGLTLREIIARGEGFDVEFKSTLRMNLVTSKKDPDIEHASLKSIAAFLNSSGGTLLIGVKDDGSVSGLESDQFQSSDRLLLHFWNLVKSSLGEHVAQYINAELDVIGGKQVLIVRVSKGSEPVFLIRKGGKEEFYIRIGPSSASLGIQETISYIRTHFKSD